MPRLLAGHRDLTRRHGPTPSQRPSLPARQPLQEPLSLVAVQLCRVAQKPSLKASARAIHSRSTQPESRPRLSSWPPECVKPFETTLAENLVYGLVVLAKPLKLRTPRAGGLPRAPDRRRHWPSVARAVVLSRVEMNRLAEPVERRTGSANRPLTGRLTPVLSPAQRRRRTMGAGGRGEPGDPLGGGWR